MDICWVVLACVGIKVLQGRIGKDSTVPDDIGWDGELVDPAINNSQVAPVRETSVNRSNGQRDHKAKGSESHSWKDKSEIME